MGTGWSGVAPPQKELAWGKRLPMSFKLLQIILPPDRGLIQPVPSPAFEGKTSCGWRLVERWWMVAETPEAGRSKDLDLREERALKTLLCNSTALFCIEKPWWCIYCAVGRSSPAAGWSHPVGLPGRDELPAGRCKNLKRTQSILILSVQFNLITKHCRCTHRQHVDISPFL